MDNDLEDFIRNRKGTGVGDILIEFLSEEFGVSEVELRKLLE